MKYIIMLSIVVGLAASDFLTGIAKAYIKNDLSSTKMRKGGINKLVEIIVMCTVCGLEIGIDMLGKYYNAAEFAEITGAAAAVIVFVYICVMELISLLENYSEINPDAKWALKIIKRLRNVQQNQQDADHASDKQETESEKKGE